MSDFVSDIVDDIKDLVHEVTGYDDVKEARQKAEKKRKEVIAERKAAEEKREKAEKKKREQMTRRTKELAGREGHSANVIGGGLLAQDDEMNPFASAS